MRGCKRTLEFLRVSVWLAGCEQKILRRDAHNIGRGIFFACLPTSSCFTSNLTPSSSASPLLSSPARATYCLSRRTPDPPAQSLRDVRYPLGKCNY
eukprot:1439027-Rhodomonas_salina.1